MSTPGITSGEGADRITVSGSGSAAAPVDRVAVALGVEVVRVDAGDAFRTAAGTVSRLLAVLSDDGVGSRSVRTADLSLGPRMDHRNGGMVVVGYAASQRLHVVLDGLAGIERLLTDVVTTGGEGVRIDGVTLSASDPVAASAQARDGAFADAQRTAQQYAALAGRRLGRVLTITEGGPEVGPRPMRMMALRDSSGPPMPIATGDTHVTETVQVTWALEG